VPPAASAWAKDGDSGGGSNSGSGSSGSGSDSSGSGSGGDDDGGDDDGDDDSDDDNSGSGNSGKKSEQDRARHAVSTGNAMPLKDALKRLREKQSGKVIDVALRKEGKRFVYSFKVKSESGSVRRVTMDAATGEIRGFLGF
jgi:uncharacterized membrane protein YkoI